MNRQSSTSRKIEKNIVIDYSIDEVKSAIKRIFDVVHMRYIPEKNGINDIFGIYQFSIYDHLRDNALCNIDISTVSERKTKIAIYISYLFYSKDTSDYSTLITILNNYLSILAKSLSGESLIDVVEDIENEDKIAQEVDNDINSFDSYPIRYDVLFAEIAREAVSSQSISTSIIQRNYEVGFNRAGRIMMQLEQAGIVGQQQGAQPREILIHNSPSLEVKLQELGLY